MHFLNCDGGSLPDYGWGLIGLRDKGQYQKFLEDADDSRGYWETHPQPPPNIPAPMLRQQPGAQRYSTRPAQSLCAAESLGGLDRWNAFCGCVYDLPSRSFKIDCGERSNVLVFLLAALHCVNRDVCRCEFSDGSVAGSGPVRTLGRKIANSVSQVQNNVAVAHDGADFSLPVRK
ncbi:MAG: hypothetical protein M1825_005705 [Sarcosagium campestre]|nr:MAG: hypothetical protein M1825_005705 [Sarcosagium campestre]